MSFRMKLKAIMSDASASILVGTLVVLIFFSLRQYYLVQVLRVDDAYSRPLSRVLPSSPRFHEGAEVQLFNINRSFV